MVGNRRGGGLDDGAGLIGLSGRPVADRDYGGGDRAVTGVARRVLGRDRVGYDAAEFRIQPGQFDRVTRAQVDLHPDLVGDGVDRGAAAHDGNAMGGLRPARHRDGADALRRGGHRVDRIDQAKRAEAVPARPPEHHAVAPRTHAAGDDALDLGAVHRQEGVDLSGVAACGEQMAHAAQVARAFLAHIAHEQDIGAGADAGRVHRAQEGQVDRQAAGVVAHPGRQEPRAFPAHGDVGTGGEDGVEMGGDHQRAAIAEAAPATHHIADLVLFNLLKAMVAQHVEVGRGARALAEGRGGDFGQGDDVGHGPVMLGPQRRAGGGEGGVGRDGRDGILHEARAPDRSTSARQRGASAAMKAAAAAGLSCITGT